MKKLIWTSRLLLPGMLALLAWTLLNHKLDYVQYEILLGAIVFGMLIALRLRLEQTKQVGKSDYDQMLSNVNEAQKLLGQKINTRWFGLLRNGNQSNIPRHIYFDRESFVDFLESSVFQLSCFSISLLIYLASLSVEAPSNSSLNIKIWVNFFLMYGIQFLFSSLFFAGLILKILKRKK